MARKDFWNVLDRSLVSRFGQLRRKWVKSLKERVVRWRGEGEAQRGMARVESFEPRLMMTASIVDDGDAGYSVVGGSWTGSTGSGYQSDYESVSAGTGAHKAVYSFTGLTPGQYRVSANWVAGSGNATNTPYRVASPSQGKVFGTYKVDQESGPNVDAPYSAYDEWSPWALLDGTMGALILTGEDGNGNEVYSQPININVTPAITLNEPQITDVTRTWDVAEQDHFLDFAITPTNDGADYYGLYWVREGMVPQMIDMIMDTEATTYRLDLKHPWQLRLLQEMEHLKRI